jgi:hypothetical protein
MRHAYRAGIATQAGETGKKLRVRAAREQGCQQRIFLRAGLVDLVDDTFWSDL